MTKRITILCLLLFVTSTAFSANDTATEDKQLTIEDIYLSDDLKGEFLNQPQWHPNSKSFTFLKADKTDDITSLWQHDIETGQETIILDGHELTRPGAVEPISLDEYCWSDNGDKILIHTDTASVWRHSQVGRCFIYDIATKAVQSVYDGDEPLTNVTISPDSKRVGYVLNNDVYTKDLSTGVTTRWTSDGSDVIINGAFDWAYEEEFSIANAWQWSPDGRKLAFWRFDQSAVPEFSWIDYNPLHQELTTIRYPKSGETVSTVKIGVIDMEAGATRWMDVGPETDQYIPRILWTNSPDTLCIERLNRVQNNLQLLLTDVNTGQGKVILTDTDPCWVEVHDNLIFLEDSKRFLWTSEKDGFNHIYLHNLDGSLIRQLTAGPWEVAELFGVDEENGCVFLSGNEKSVIERHIYSVNLDGNGLHRLSEKDGWHGANFSCDYGHFIDSYSNARTPMQSLLCRTHGATVRMIADGTPPGMSTYALSSPEFFTVPTGDGATLDAWMIKPVDFDSTKRYPVLVYCYGGPRGMQVYDCIGKQTGLKWYLRMNYIAQHGYLILCVDNRGIEGRGKADRNLVYTDLAKWAIHDQIEGAKYLATLPYVDNHRIGIYGWSFGGYLTLLAMTIGSDYFAVGVSGAPVSKWELYDAIYTERYMKKPSENPDGYQAASIFTHLDRLKGKLLLIHGMSDDNVHVQNSMQLVEQMQLKGKQFDLMVYPGKHHGVSGAMTNVHLWTMVCEFIFENL